jgi:hypothetical protein
VPAHYLIATTINWYIEGRVSPCAIWNDRPGRIPFQIRPSNLLGAIWLQFALAVDGAKKYRACKGCGRWFELSPQTGRISKLFCSDSCRVRAHRERRERARHLFREGRKAPTIARELEIDEQTVKNWIRTFRKEK